MDGAAIDFALKECAETLWQVPESIGAALHTGDPVADGLEYLYAHQKGRVKIGYVISLRDCVLMRYQNFIDTKKEMGWPPEAGERMERIICGTVKRLSASGRIQRGDFPLLPLDSGIHAL